MKEKESKWRNSGLSVQRAFKASRFVVQGRLRRSVTLGRGYRGMSANGQRRGQGCEAMRDWAMAGQGCQAMKQLLLAGKGKTGHCVFRARRSFGASLGQLRRGLRGVPQWSW
jgi:hypothetical protein